MNLYFISGLGVDKRVFYKLKLPSYFSLYYIDWIEPKFKEPVAQYAQRLSRVIDTTGPFSLIGLSFGGMMACEIAKFLQPVQTIIISSASNKKELPPYYKWIGFLGLNKFIPYNFLKKPNLLFHWLFGIQTAEEKVLFRQILKDADTAVLKWSLHTILNWQNVSVPPGLIHLHGNKDKVLPVKYTQPTYIIKGGEHFMVHSRAAEISRLLTAVLKKN